MLLLHEFDQLQALVHKIREWRAVMRSIRRKRNAFERLQIGGFDRESTTFNLAYKQVAVQI